MSSAVSLLNHTFTGQALSSKRLTSIVHILSPESVTVKPTNTSPNENFQYIIDYKYIILELFYNMVHYKMVLTEDNLKGGS